MTTPPDIEYFYSAHSAYAYLGAWELERIAAKHNVRVHHRPFDFHPVVNAAGSQPFKERSAAHVDYFFGRELIRWAEWRDLPILTYRPTYHDNPLILPNCAIIAAGDAAGAFSKAVLQAHWRDDADIADPAVLRALATDVGLSGDALLAAAQTPDVQAKHEANTKEAAERGICGSPTYFGGGDRFYGQDRLMMVDRALERPFAP